MPTTSELLFSLSTRSAEHSYAPYSNRREGVVVLLEDGSVVHGCRVENASFPLTISALLNAMSTLHSVARMDIAMIASSRAFTEAEKAYLCGMPNFEWIFPDSTTAHLGGTIPEPKESLFPLLPDWGTSTMKGAEQARDISDLAWCPESDFPVGSVIRTANGHHIPGVNVEHPDWSQGLCAERNALSAIIAYDYGMPTEIYVSCPKESGGTPCGACRQVILELAPEATVWMDRIDGPPQAMTAQELLPGGFSGDVLRKPKL